MLQEDSLGPNRRKRFLQLALTKGNVGSLGRW